MWLHDPMSLSSGGLATKLMKQDMVTSIIEKETALTRLSSAT